MSNYDLPMVKSRKTPCCFLSTITVSGSDAKLERKKERGKRRKLLTHASDSTATAVVAAVPAALTAAVALPAAAVSLTYSRSNTYSRCSAYSGEVLTAAAVLTEAAVLTATAVAVTAKTTRFSSPSPVPGSLVQWSRCMGDRRAPLLSLVSDLNENFGL
jgi:hypothetical protein